MQTANLVNIIMPSEDKSVHKNLCTQTKMNCDKNQAKLYLPEKGSPTQVVIIMDETRMIGKCDCDIDTG